jgi:predicted HicB family RNase H-like nuclease
MNGHFEYKGYLGSAEVDTEESVLVGKLLYIRDTITYSATDVAALKTAFEEAVDDYLGACEEDGVEPDQPCKGSFNVRVGAERHRRVAIAARIAGVGLNEFVCSSLDAATSVPRTVLHRHEVRVLTSSPNQANEFTALTSASDVTAVYQSARPH